MIRIVSVAFVLFYFSMIPAAAEEWGKTGHRAVGEIAEEHLSPKAKTAVAGLLDNHSLAFVANFADEIKSDKKYDSYSPWHYVNFPFGEKYETYPKSEAGDIVQGIETCIAVLKDENSSKEQQVFYLKMLIHLIGDLHQPLHAAIGEDKGGNTFQVRWFQEGTNLHKVWDSHLLNYYQMSYTELAANADKLSQTQIFEIQQGTVLDWLYDTREVAEDIYENTRSGQKLGYDYAYRYMDTVRVQLQKGGIRLAGLLNEIFQ